MDSLVKDPEIRVELYILMDSLPEGHDCQNKLATKLKTEIGKTTQQPTTSLKSLSSVLAGYEVTPVSDFFDTNHNAVLVSVGLGGLLDAQLNDKHKQANKDKHIEIFSSNKEHMIKSVLNQLFKKVVLDYLIVDNELILEFKEVKSAVNNIMEGWIRKQIALISLSVHWSN
ncbi:hypothetical protein G9A89_006285 [Geosiphon pyriformis]|nr:hypothetical protein G9A89_006285 [Geosiphon pyriformis]